MPVAPIVSAGNGVPFLVSAGIVYEIIAAACSSPQTAEINADKRAGTLMKWVHIGLVQSVLFIGIAVAVDRAHARPIVAGGGLAAGIMYGSYLHAKASGLANPGAGTEGQQG
jgi:NADH:ubiquinone oxidoreductase subunit 4 (subunit M)